MSSLQICYLLVFLSIEEMLIESERGRFMRRHKIVDGLDDKSVFRLTVRDGAT